MQLIELHWIWLCNQGNSLRSDWAKFSLIFWKSNHFQGPGLASFDCWTLSAQRCLINFFTDYLLYQSFCWKTLDFRIYYSNGYLISYPSNFRRTISVDVIIKHGSIVIKYIDMISQRHWILCVLIAWWKKKVFSKYSHGSKVSNNLFGKPYSENDVIIYCFIKRLTYLHFRFTEKWSTSEGNFIYIYI